MLDVPSTLSVEEVGSVEVPQKKTRTRKKKAE